MKRIVLIGSLLALAGVAQAGELSEKEARARALAFLTRGPRPLRPQLGATGLAQARVQVDRELSRPAERGTCSEVLMPPEGPLAYCVRVNPRGEVVAYTADDRHMVVATRDAGGERRPAAERQAEIRKRVRFDARALRQRAKELLARVIPHYAERRFRVRYAELDRESRIVEWRLGLEERAPKGVLAVYPNRISLALNPESGEVVRFRRTAVDEVLRRAPPVDGARARELATRQGRVERCELLLMVRKNEPVPVWLVVTRRGGRSSVAFFSATTGEPVEPRETLD
jgi:hypothetical protein